MPQRIPAKAVFDPQSRMDGFGTTGLVSTSRSISTVRCNLITTFGCSDAPGYARDVSAGKPSTIGTCCRWLCFTRSLRLQDSPRAERGPLQFRETLVSRNPCTHRAGTADRCDRCPGDAGMDNLETEFG
jgi:hypothetical protein